MSTQLGVARLIDDAFKLFDLASAQLGEGKLSAASNLLVEASHGDHDPCDINRRRISMG